MLPLYAHLNNYLLNFVGSWLEFEFKCVGYSTCQKTLQALSRRKIPHADGRRKERSMLYHQL